MMQGHVKEVTLENFKSYEGQVQAGPFKKFTCIVGPNGAGKSNLMDAISFVLGVRTRHLRGDRLQDLVHRKEEEPPEAAERRRSSVELVYANDAGQEGIAETRRFRRVIQPSTEARYQIDGQAVSQEAYLSSLEEINILSKARNFLVFQGDVEAAAHRQGKDLTAFFEQVSGSVALREEHDKLASDKASREDSARDLYTRKRNALNEKKRMSQQKEEAEKYRAMESERRKLQAEFILFRLCSAASLAEEAAAGLSDAKGQAEAAAAEGQAVRRQLNEAEEERAEAFLAEAEAERALASERRQLEALSPPQIQVRTELQAAQRRLTESSATLGLDDQRRERLEGQAAALRERLTSLEAELDQERQEARKEMPFTTEQWEHFRRAQEETERLRSASSQEAKELERRLQALSRRRALADQERREAWLRVEHLKQKVEDLKASEVAARVAHDSTSTAAAERRTELQELANKCKAYRGSKKELEDERQQILEAIQDIAATERQLEHERRLTQVCTDLSQVVLGVRGRVVNLCEPVQKRFRVAVNVAIGGHLDAVVTQTVEGARACVQHLKERMMTPLTFLPLDNLRGMGGDRRLQEALRSEPKLRLALSCISFDASLSRAFDFLLAEVVVADSLEDGQRFVFGPLKELGLKCRVVTINGETISRDGNMAVNADGAKKGSTRFDFSELEVKQSRLEALDSKLAEERSKFAAQEGAHAALEDETRRLEAEALDSELTFRRLAAELTARSQELRDLAAAAEELPTGEALAEEEQQLRQRLQATEEGLGEAVAGHFTPLAEALGVVDVRHFERELRLSREAAQQHESALSQEHAGFKAELAKIELTLQDRHSRNAVELAREVEAHVQRLRLRQGEMEAKLEVQSRAVEEKASALQEKRELEKVQEQACAQLRAELKEKDRAASELDRQRASLAAELESAKEARFELLRQSVLEDIDLPFAGSAKDSKQATKKLAAIVADPAGASPQLADELRLDFRKLPEAKRVAAAAGGPAAKLLEDEYRDELRRLSGELEQLKPNLKAIEQLEEVDQAALQAEREAQRARKKMEDIDRSFEKVRTERREKFMGCFRKVQDEIQTVYKRLTQATAAGFDGGAAFLDLEDLEDPWNGGVKFTAMPPAKRFCDITLLSGGEKTVAAMALLFAMQAYQRPPFLVLDEIDAYLDHSNVQALANYIASVDCQAIVISQKDRFFSKGEGLVGVSKDRSRNASVIFTMDMARLRQSQGKKPPSAPEVPPLQ